MRRAVLSVIQTERSFHMYSDPRYIIRSLPRLSRESFSDGMANISPLVSLGHREIGIMSMDECMRD